MTINSIRSIPSIPEKVKGVNTYTDTAFHDHAKEHTSTNFENPMHVVDDLEKYLGCNITGFSREILEAMASFNLREQYATVNDINKALKGKHYDMVRRTILELSDKKGNPFIITLQDKKGKAHQYVLANMQDIVKHENKVKGEGTSSMECNKDTNDSSYYHYNNILESMLIKILSDKPNPEIHNITLETQLKYSEDYKRLYGDEWRRPSSRNQAKVLERFHSRHRKSTIMVYPSGKVMIAIKATNHPFQWYSYDDWMIIRGEICGSIYQRFKDSLSIEPLIHT